MSWKLFRKPCFINQRERESSGPRSQGCKGELLKPGTSMWGKAEAVMDKGRDRQGAGIREGLCVPVISSRSERAGLPFSCKNRKNFSVAEGLLQYSEGGAAGEKICFCFCL